MKKQNNNNKTTTLAAANNTFKHGFKLIVTFAHHLIDI
jgi:hypothetical protein